MEHSIHFHQLVKNQSHSAIIIAPTGWGKTSLVFDLCKRDKVVFISPLRIIAEEVYDRAKKTLNTFYLKNSEDVLAFCRSKRGLLVTTVEKVLQFQELLYGRELLFVLDEFHLFWLWQSFRPSLEEILMGVCSHSERLMALSATFGPELIERAGGYFHGHYIKQHVIDLSKSQPSKKVLRDRCTFYLSKKRFLKMASFIIQRDGINSLYFVRSRKEVDFVGEYFRRQGLNVLTCKGGQVGQFYEELTKACSPFVIVSTSALSHGANLPVLRNVFISYSVSASEMFYQMKGRGGRDNKGFSFYHRNQGQIEWKWLLISFIFSTVIGDIFSNKPKIRDEDKNRRYSSFKGPLWRSTYYWKAAFKKW